MEPPIKDPPRGGHNRNNLISTKDTLQSPKYSFSHIVNTFRTPEERTASLQMTKWLAPTRTFCCRVDDERLLNKKCSLSCKSSDGCFFSVEWSAAPRSVSRLVILMDRGCYGNNNNNNSVSYELIYFE